MRNVRKIFTSNWYIYRVCLPSILKASETPRSVTSLEVSGSTGGESLFAKKQGRCGEGLSLCLTQAEVNAEVFVSRGSRLRSHGFERLLLEAVDEGLSSLGELTKQAVYFHLEKTFKISKRDIPYKIDEFANAIEGIFGSGAKLLEIQIMRRLHEKVGHVYKYFPEGRDDLVFAEYVRAVRASLRQKTKCAKNRKGLTRSA